MNSNSISKRMFMVLEAIRMGRDVVHLNRAGIEYHQLLQCIDDGKGQGWIKVEGNAIELTSAGKVVLDLTRERKKYGGPSTWISPKESASIKPLASNMIYLPSNKWRSD